RRSRRRPGSRRAGAGRPSACTRRAAPARAAGSSCRRASARGEPSAAWSGRRACRVFACDHRACTPRISAMRELRPGVWHWQSPHPDWVENEDWWPELVSSYAVELGDDFVLFDPLAVPDELRERATSVVLTAPYHERDARSLGLPEIGR